MVGLEIIPVYPLPVLICIQDSSNVTQLTSTMSVQSCSQSYFSLEMR